LCQERQARVFRLFWVGAKENGEDVLTPTFPELPWIEEGVDNFCAVVACWGHCNKSTIDWVAYPTEIYCLTILEAGSLRSKYQLAGSLDSFWGMWGRICCRPLSLTCRWPCFPWVWHCILICLCVHLLPCYTDRSHTGLGSTLKTFFF
jgi:hypothetical protein